MAREVNPKFEAEVRQLVRDAIASPKSGELCARAGLTQSTITAFIMNKPVLDGTLMRAYAGLGKTKHAKDLYAMITPDEELEAPAAAAAPAKKAAKKAAPKPRGAAAIPVTGGDDDEDDEEDTEEEEEDDSEE
jgi:hypothetical protein